MSEWYKPFIISSFGNILTARYVIIQYFRILPVVKTTYMKLNQAFIFLFAACVATMTYGQKQAIETPAWVNTVGCKSEAPRAKVYLVNDYGALADGESISTMAIQKAIDDCAKKGGGTVRFKAGTYVSGSIFIKSKVRLQIDEDVLILGSENLADYPEIDTRIAGIETRWPAALFNFLDVSQAELSGKGVVNARGKFCWDLYWEMRKEYDKKGLRWIVDYDAKRVRTVLVQNAENILLKDLTFKNAGFWTVQLLYSTKLTVDGLTILNNEDGHGPSTDGVDVDSSSDVLIQNCDIDCNDDNFCLKSGRDWDGLRVNRPTEYVVIKNCIARRGAGLVTLGSETSGSIRHIYCTDLYAKNTDNGLRIKSATTRGGVIEDVYFVNSKLDSVRNAYQFNLNWYPAYSYSELPPGYEYDSLPQHWKALLQKVEPKELGIPRARNFFIKNVQMGNVKKAFEVAGLENSLIENFIFMDSAVSASSIGSISHTKSWVFDNFSLDILPEAKTKDSLSTEELERLK